MLIWIVLFALAGVGGLVEVSFIYTWHLVSRSAGDYSWFNRDYSNDATIARSRRIEDTRREQFEPIAACVIAVTSRATTDLAGPTLPRRQSPTTLAAAEGQLMPKGRMALELSLEVVVVEQCPKEQVDAAAGDQIGAAAETLFAVGVVALAKAAAPPGR
jgi:hypothetical protein